MQGYSIIGQRLPGKDDALKATGSAEYTSDLALSGMLHGKILRSPYPHARILNIDVSKAEALSGVKKVVTGKNALGVKYGILGLVPKSFDEQGLAMEKVRLVTKLQQLLQLTQSEPVFLRLQNPDSPGYACH